MKQVLKGTEVLTAAFHLVRQNESINLEEIIEKLGLPLFVKPANMGSSVGITKIYSKEELSHNFSKRDSAKVYSYYLENRDLSTYFKTFPVYFGVS